MSDITETPDHIAEAIKATKEYGTETEEDKLSAAAQEEDPKASELYTFQFQYGEYAGEFTNKILTIREKQLAGLLQARLNQGLPYESISAIVQEINFCIAWMTYSLTKRPKWADDLGGVLDEELIQNLYKEVAAHEATFRLPRTNKGAS